MGGPRCSWPGRAEALLTISLWSFPLIQATVVPKVPFSKRELDSLAFPPPLETFCFSFKELPRFGCHLFLAWKVHKEPSDVLLTCSRVNFLKRFLVQRL